MALEFTINLKGDFAGALHKGTSELDEHKKKTKEASKELELFENELGKVQAGALELNFNAFKEGGHFLTFDMAEGAALAYEAVEKVVDKVIELGTEIVKAAADAEDLNLAIKLDVGEEGADKVGELAESFRGTAFGPKAIKEALLPILEQSGDEENDQWDDLSTAATDVATRRHTGVAGAKAALQALDDIELNPQRLRGSLKELGIKQLDFYNDLGGLLGISEKAAEKQVKEGSVKSKTLLSVALNEIAEREGGALGNATNEGSKTLGASLARLANLKDELFEKLAGSEGLKRFQGALDTFVETLQGPVGTDLINTIDGAFTTLFGDLSGPEGAKKLQAVISEVEDDVKSMVKSFEEAWPDIKAGAEDLWVVLRGIAKTVGTIVDGWVQLENFVHDWDSGRITKDIADTIHGEHGGIATGNAPKNMHWDESIQGYRPNDADIPKFASGGMVSTPTIALIGESGPEAVIPLGRAFGSLPDSTMPSYGGAAFGSIEISYAPHFSYSGASHEVRQQIDDSEQRVRIELEHLVDELRAKIGASAL